MSQAQHSSLISLCMIVRNEEHTIAGAIESVRPIVSEIIVVDTGSEDTTVARARSLGATVHTYAWEDDFSKARNFSLQHAHQPWILVLDADECIALRDHKSLIEITGEVTCRAAVLTQRNYCNCADAEGWRANDYAHAESRGYSGFFDVPVIRLFRNDPAIRFQGVIHEVVDQAIPRTEKRYLDAVIHHFTHLENAGERLTKSEFYLKLLRKQLDSDPNDSTTWFLLGRQYYTLGKYAEAIVFLKRVVDSGSKCEMAYDNLAAAYIQGGMFEEALQVLEKVIMLNPRYTEAYSTLGIVQHERGQQQEAEAMFLKAIALEPRAFKPYFNLAALYYRNRQLPQAYETICRAEQLSSDTARLWYLKFSITCDLEKWNEANVAGQTLRGLDQELYHNIAVLHQSVQQRCSSAQEANAS